MTEQEFETEFAKALAKSEQIKLAPTTIYSVVFAPCIHNLIQRALGKKETHSQSVEAHKLEFFNHSNEYAENAEIEVKFYFAEISFNKSAVMRFIRVWQNICQTIYKQEDKVKGNWVTLCDLHILPTAKPIRVDDTREFVPYYEIGITLPLNYIREFIVSEID